MYPFVHLHVHSQYSVLDGQAAVKKLVDKAIGDGMKGIALTDHGNMFGIKEFTDYVNKKNKDADKEIKAIKNKIEELKSAENPDSSEMENLVKSLEEAESKIFIPIVGCEMYVAEKSLKDRDNKRDTGRHLVVLAKNEVGYHNLIKLVSKAWTDGYYYHPRTDKAELAAHKEGLIICSACLGGELPRYIMNGQVEEAKKSAKWFKDTFGEDYYIELQLHKPTVPNANKDVYPHQVEVNKALIQIARELDIKLICTNDVHFVNESTRPIDMHFNRNVRG